MSTMGFEVAMTGSEWRCGEETRLALAGMKGGADQGVRSL
jgi:hypothetical protein